MIEAGFDQEWAETTVEQLARQGVEFTTGLSAADLAAVADLFGAPIPSEFALLLQVAVPTSPKWARWAEGPEVVVTGAREWIHHGFAFDVEHGDYWHPSFGPRPARLADAIERALAVVDEAPPLFPIYAHRFLASQPVEGPRAVLSVWQAVDSIFYGNDLADYLTREFGIERPSWATAEAPPVPVWQDLFDLFCVGLPDRDST